MAGIVSKIESLSAVDGDGLRAVAFLQGCPWRCGYCHNPETWAEPASEDTPPEVLAAKLARFAPYLSNGGYTFSGGEPLLHAGYIRRVVACFPPGARFAVETSGSFTGEEVQRLLPLLDLVICDVKAVDDAAYRQLTGGLSLARVLEFLDLVKSFGKRLWIRQVIVPGYNDQPENAKKLGELMRPYRPERVELLPFRKLCTEKYEEMGVAFPFAEFAEADSGRISELEKLVREVLE